MTKLDCVVVQDLLPNYIEGLTSPETNRQIEAHLADCADCREACAAMRGELTTPAPPASPRQLHFLRKVKRSRLWAALTTVILTLLCLYGLYALEYRWHDDKHSIELALNLYYGGTAETLANQPPYLLESYSSGRRLYAFFELANMESSYGIMVFQRGFDGRYRYRELHTYTSPYAATLFITRDGERGPYLIGGYQLQGVSYIGICLADENQEQPPLTDIHDYQVIGQTIILPVERQQFLYVLGEQELLASAGLAQTDGSYSLGPFFARYRFYDAALNDITPEYNNGGGGWSRAGGEHWLAYGITLLLGYFITRYFLTD